MGKFKVSEDDFEIQKIDTVKETEKSVWMKTKLGNIRQERKESASYKYFNHFNLAKTYLLNKWIKKIVTLESMLEEEKKTLEKIKAFEEI